MNDKDKGTACHRKMMQLYPNNETNFYLIQIFLYQKLGTRFNTHQVLGF